RHDGNGNGNGNGHDNDNGNGHDALRVSTLDPQTGEAQPIHIPELSLPPRNEQSQTTKALSQLRAVVLLGGSVRATELSASVGRSILDLPVDEGGSILNHWLMHAAEFAHY